MIETDSTEQRANNKSVCLIVLNEFRNDSRVLKEALSLSRHGYKVQVLAMHGHDLPARETVGEVSVARVKLWTRSWSKHKAVQAIKYAEFLLKALFSCRKFDVLHCNDLNALPIGVLSRLFRFGRQKIVYDAHEFEINRHGSTHGAMLRLTSSFEGMLLRHADAVITVSQSIAKAYRRIYRIKMPALVLNCPPYRKAGTKYDRFREEFGIREDQTIFLYQGGLSPGRGIEMLLEAFSKRQDDSAVAVFMGYGTLEDTIKTAAKVSKQIFFHPSVPVEHVLDYSGSADFGVTFIEGTSLSYAWCLPNKLFEYLMSGLPVLASNLVEQRRIIERFGVGVCATDWSLRGLNDAIDRIMAVDWSGSGKRMEEVRKIYCWENQERNLLGVYASL